MSCLPAKKKSCFQITSVTQAQEAGNSIIDETESNDDPDDSRADDVSSEMFDVLGLSDCSFSEEAVNHTGEHLNGAALVNGVISVRGIGTGGRFRVIKLDHGTGEPFRRGRWTCTEFYEKESESSRTVDTVKSTVTHEHSTDSGLVISNSSFSVQSVENIDGALPKVPIPPSEPLPQGYTLVSAFQPTGYATTTTSHVSVQPVVSQTFVANSLNGVHQTPMLQLSPLMPPATQPQHLAFSNPGISSGFSDYHLQHFGSNTQGFHATSQPSVPHSSQVLLPLSPPGPEGKTPLGQGAEAAPAVAAVSQTSGAMGITASSPISIPSHSGATSIGGSEDPILGSDTMSVSISTAKPLTSEGLSLSAPTVSLFGITIPVDEDDDSASGASVVAIDNKIEQAMDLVKNHLMYAVREEVEVLKEQIKELYERNSVLERENAVLKSLANSEQLNKLSSQLSQVNSNAIPQLHQHSLSNSNALGHYEVVRSAPHQPNITSA